MKTGNSLFILMLILITTLLAPASLLGDMVQDNPHGTLSIDCMACHTVESWNILRRDMAFDHGATVFPLEGQHGQVECLACHTDLSFSGTSTQCVDCHTDIHENQFGNSCETCHAPDRWFDELAFRMRHLETRFPLTGVHENLDCQSCHATGQYVGLSTECIGCHLNTFENTINPDHVAAQFSVNCQQCHGQNIITWDNASYVHTTAFPLTDAHNINDCLVCHSQQYIGLSSMCFDCHESDYSSAADPNHSGYPTDCETCHTRSNWQPAEYDHALSGFTIDGAHLTLDCLSCHGEGYTGTPNTCYGCHQADVENVDDPNHQEAGFSNDCQDCHNTNDWESVQFDHNNTDFLLTGAHIPLDCNECHSEGYTGTPNTCYGCHQADVENVEDPNHQEAGFSNDCQDCHNTNDWESVQFDHADTDFLLTGAHIPLDCNECHSEGYSGTPTDCYSCHQVDYEEVDDPNHVSSAYPVDCVMCHTTEVWSPAEFDHANTDFPLTGAHTELNCLDCHSEGYQNTPIACFDCHSTDYSEADDPVHNLPSFSHECTECHTTSDWESTTFDHNSQTEYMLEGAHTEVSCALCHPVGVYDGTPTDCWSCHEVDYNEADDPDHADAGFPQDCTTCHSMSAWTPADFDHDQTDFPLTGAHETLNCSACHSEGYTGTPTDCYACHQADYDNSASPSHSAAGFETTCTTCHNTTAWSPSSWTHNDTDWPLTGAHTTVDCSLCHINNQYDGTPSECYFCHQTDYNNATDPNHQSAGFPTDCTECHTTTAWDPANFNHLQYFPIYSGEHRGEWDTCSDCHTNQNDFAVFSCIDCHEHRQSEMDDEHDDVSGYSYNSLACYQCHPDGRADDDRLLRDDVEKKAKRLDR